MTIETREQRTDPPSGERLTTTAETPERAAGLPAGERLTMTTRDGAELVASLWRPTSGGTHPVLLARTPYGRDPAGPGVRLDLSRLLEAGYAVVVQDVRGTGESGGESRFFGGEAADGHDAVRWAATRSWSDGNVGMFGDSYLGLCQLLAARERPEGLRAIAPGVTPLGYHEMLYSDGGVPRLDAVLTIGAVTLATDELKRRIRLGTAAAQDVAAHLAALGFPDRFPQTMLELARRLPPTDQPLIADLVPFYAEWMGNPDPDAELWREASMIGRHADIEVPALVSSGWYDFYLGGSIGHYKRLCGGSRLIIGPWSHFTHERQISDRDYGPHASAEAVDWTGLHLDWFDHWLRGGPLRDDAGVRIFVMGSDEWRSETAWPLPDARPTPYHLGEDGVLGTEPRAGGRSFTVDPNDPVPSVGGAVMTFDAFGPLDQRPLDGRTDVLRYESAPLERPVEVTGPVELVVRISSTAPDTDVTGKLVDVHPGGRAELLTDGVARVRSQGGLLVPGEIREVRVELGATSNVFRAGHRIRLDIAGSNFPKYGRNSQTGGVIHEEVALEKAVTTIHAPSYAVLPIVDRAGA